MTHRHLYYYSILKDNLAGVQHKVPWVKVQNFQNPEF